jgi:trans-aconitate methyltransferase
MTSLVADTWERGNPYERYIGRWSRRVAPPFLDWLALPARRTWVDVGCGTGALCATILDRCHPKTVTGIEPSQGFLDVAAEALHGRAALRIGNATSPRWATRRPTSSSPARAHSCRTCPQR